MHDSDELELGIDPRKINETEERQFVLLLNLMRNRSGLSFRQLKNIMKDYYSNENSESDQKKLQRDIEELKEQGYTIKFFKTAFDSAESNVYKLEESKKQNFIKFSEDELRTLSFTILKNYEENPSYHLFTASQKIFSHNLQYFPEITEKNNKPDRDNSGVSEILYKIMTAIKNRSPIKIEYYKNNPDEVSVREIEPLQIIKRNAEDFYLIVFDRIKKEKRRFLIPKIKKVTDMNGEFIFNGKITDEDLNYHPLNFKVHEEETLTITCNPDGIDKLEKFLYPHAYSKENNRIILKTTNRSGLFGFIFKENDVVTAVDSVIFLNEFKDYINKIKGNYSSY